MLVSREKRGRKGGGGEWEREKQEGERGYENPHVWF